MSRYIVEIDARAVKEYVQKARAIRYARQWLTDNVYDDYKPCVNIHKFDGSEPGEIVWTNWPNYPDWPED